MKSKSKMNKQNIGKLEDRYYMEKKTVTALFIWEADSKMELGVQIY